MKRRDCECKYCSEGVLSPAAVGLLLLLPYTRGNFWRTLRCVRERRRACPSERLPWLSLGSAPGASCIKSITPSFTIAAASSRAASTHVRAWCCSRVCANGAIWDGAIRERGGRHVDPNRGKQRNRGGVEDWGVESVGREGAWGGGRGERGGRPDVVPLVFATRTKQTVESKGCGDSYHPRARVELIIGTELLSRAS